ncbi:hypothetical protein [Actinoallomurus sp. NPDC050550]|uniref:hypothetical protein n=1 Tax=Actinoallomurus sp. NPDC050550 TaxID=3154937 RepID=UPI0033E29D3F
MTAKRAATVLTMTLVAGLSAAPAANARQSAQEAPRTVAAQPVRPAIPFQCNMHGNNWCAHVTAIDSGSYLALHRKPDYEHGTVSGVQYHNGDTVGLICWTTGDPDADGNGDTYWFDVTDQNYNYGYVNDWYLTTGGYNDWHGHVPECGPIV